MAKRIGNLSVGKISLLTSEHNPAVEKASTKFSILKFFSKKTPENENTQKLDSIIAKFSTPKQDKLSEVIAKFEQIANKNK